MSSGENTFTYWKTENFLVDWTVIEGSFTESNGILTSTGAINKIYMEENHGPALLYEEKIRLVAGTSLIQNRMAYLDASNFYLYGLWHTGWYMAYKVVEGIWTKILETSWTPDTNWHTIGIWWENLSRLVFYYDHAQVGASDEGDPALTQGYFGFVVTTSPGYMDWYRIRKFVSPEPTASAGAQQTIQ